jgi:HD-GYP domain-containing protein (c-di-GMP phosphodiesterase class II)
MANREQASVDFEERLQRLIAIGVALSVERDLNVLLDRILSEARNFTRAEAGTLYLARDDHLTFEITQNDKLNVRMGGRHGGPSLPPVHLDKNTYSGYAAVTGETLNIADVYDENDARSEGPKSYDQQSGYRTKSMLVVPMKDHEDQISGVLQLINAIDPEGEQPSAFTDSNVRLIEAMASQAAVAINNARLIKDTEGLFESFVQVMATAIDERSPYTGGHIRRVAEITMEVAHAINGCKSGPLAGVEFTEDQLNELRIAGWMHDIGKITTPEGVVDKPTKLAANFDRIELLKARFAVIRKLIELELSDYRLERLSSGKQEDPTDIAIFGRRLEEVDEELAFLVRANTPGEFMRDEDLELVQQIARKTYCLDGETMPYLTENEVHNLSIRKGSLTEAERLKINDHAAMSIKMLNQIPFTRKLRRVPEIAGAHHEKLDGSGYPQKLKGDQISTQSRILALVDIFESLSADDRPYRAKPIPRELVLKILKEEVDAGHLDKDVHDLFVSEKLYEAIDRIKERDAGRPAPD